MKCIIIIIIYLFMVRLDKNNGSCNPLDELLSG